MTALRLVYPALLVVFGLLMLCNPGWFREAKRREYQKRLAARTERGEDAYFEELRELEAYPPPRTVYLWQALGAVLFALGAFIIADRLTT
ncbi:MAG TPA: hypothetical protein VK614_11390 [Allosphingosinicella sp.]|nr:hypothetical protein [Allosphingosinicella sp.]